MSRSTEWEEDSDDETRVFAAFRKKGSCSAFQTFPAQSQMPVGPHQEIPQVHNQVVNYDPQAQLSLAYNGLYPGWNSTQNYKYANVMHNPPGSEFCYNPSPIQQPPLQQLSRDRPMIIPSTSTDIHHSFRKKVVMPQYGHKYMDKTPRESLYDSSEVLGFKQQFEKLYMLMRDHCKIWKDKVSSEKADRICHDNMDMSPDYSVPDSEETRIVEGPPQHPSVALSSNELMEEFFVGNLKNKDSRNLQSQQLTGGMSSSIHTEKAIEEYIRSQRSAPIPHETLVQEVVTPSVQNDKVVQLQGAKDSSSDSDNMDSGNDDSDIDHDSFEPVSISTGVLLEQLRRNATSASVSGNKTISHQPKESSCSYRNSQSNPKSPIQSPTSLSEKKLPSPKSPVQFPGQLKVKKLSSLVSRDDKSYQPEETGSSKEPQIHIMSPTRILGPSRAQKDSFPVTRDESSFHELKKTSCDERPQTNSKSPTQTPGKKAYYSGRARAVLDSILSGKFESNKVLSQSGVEPRSLSGTVDQIIESCPDTPSLSKLFHAASSEENQLPHRSEDNIQEKLGENDIDVLIKDELEQFEELRRGMDDSTNNGTNKDNPNPLLKEKDKSDDTYEERSTSKRVETEKTQRQMPDATPSSFSKEREKELSVNTSYFVMAQNNGSKKASKQLSGSTSQSSHTKNTVQISRPNKTPTQASDSTHLISSKEKEVRTDTSDTMVIQSDESEEASKQIPGSMSDSTPQSSSKERKIRMDTTEVMTKNQTVESKKTSKQTQCSSSQSDHTESESQISENHSSSGNSKYSKHQTKGNHLDKSDREYSKEKWNKYKHKTKHKRKSSSKKSKHSDEYRHERKHKRKDEDREHDQRKRKKQKTKDEQSSGNMNDGEINKESSISDNHGNLFESSTSDNHRNLSSEKSRHRTDSELSESGVDQHALEGDAKNKDGNLGESSTAGCSDHFNFVTKGRKYLDNVKSEDKELDSVVSDLSDMIEHSDNSDMQFKDEPMDDSMYNVKHENEPYLKRLINTVLNETGIKESCTDTYDKLYKVLQESGIKVWSGDTFPRLYEVEANLRRLLVFVACDRDLKYVEEYTSDIPERMKEPLRDFLDHLDLHADMEIVTQ